MFSSFCLLIFVSFFVFYISSTKNRICQLMMMNELFRFELDNESFELVDQPNEKMMCQRWGKLCENKTNEKRKIEWSRMELFFVHISQLFQWPRYELTCLEIFHLWMCCLPADFCLFIQFRRWTLGTTTQCCNHSDVQCQAADEINDEQQQEDTTNSYSNYRWRWQYWSFLANHHIFAYIFVFKNKIFVFVFRSDRIHAKQRRMNGGGKTKTEEKEKKKRTSVKCVVIFNLFLTSIV